MNKNWAGNIEYQATAVKVPTSLSELQDIVRQTPKLRAFGSRHSVSAEPCTAQMGEIGPWFERLPHFRMDFTPSFGEELQSEFFVPIAQAVPALQALNQIREQFAPQLFISEIRTVAADQLWLSPCYQQTCIALHFTWKPNWPEVKKILPLIEAVLGKFNGRPHWGKLFTMSPEVVQKSYVKLPEFQRLCQEIDPIGKFKNRFIQNVVF